MVRRITMLVPVLALASACSGKAEPAPTPYDITAAAPMIDAYIDQRDDAPADATSTLSDWLKKKHFSASDVEGLLRAPRASYPPLTVNPGHEIGLESIDCYHVVYSSMYYLFVPETYDASKAWPLVFVGHGGNSSMTLDEAEAAAKNYIYTYRTSLHTDSFQPILVAPATTVGWSPIGDSLFESSISKVIREYNVDADKVYVVGQSMGGHLSWRSALKFSDRFAAYSPQSGGYTNYIDNHQIQNLYATHGYTTFGSMDIYDLTATNITLGNWLAANKYDWTIVEKTGGHDIYSDEQPKIAAFFEAHPRDLYRRTTYLYSSGSMVYDGNWAGQDQQIVANHPLRWNYRHWVEITPRPDTPDPLTFFAKNNGGNQLELHTSNVRHLTVLLHPNMVDMTKPVVIKINGVEAYNAVPPVDIGQMLERVREFDDRGRIFHAAIGLDVATDEIVPDPVVQ